MEDAKINDGYSLRFESAVENQKYHINNLFINLTTEQMAVKTEGTGYIKYVRLMKL